MTLHAVLGAAHGAAVLPERPDPVTVLPHRGRGPDSRWHVLRARAGQERFLQAALRGLGIAAYVPLRRRARRLGVFVPHLPLFPEHVFLWGARGELAAADRTCLVAHVLRVPDQAQLEDELANVERALAAGVVLGRHPPVACEFRVRVASGPAEGVEGVLADRSSRDRLVLPVRMLHAAIAADVRGARLVPLDE